MTEIRPSQQDDRDDPEKTEKKPPPKPRSPTVFGSLRRRDILVLATFWLLALCVVGIVLIFFMLRGSNVSQPPAYEIQPGEVTARNLYSLAHEAAVAWESDVQFISASATWNTVSIPELEAPIDWVYRFYSPGLQRILFVIVTPEQQVIVRPHLEVVRRELRVIDSESWQLDSPAAITAWLNDEGGAWLQQAANPVVSVQLAFNITENVPMWRISGLDAETGQTVLYTIRATSP